jgi:methylenetetrahydrofolate dehydrogenase (NADP+)/methenyltetrahydrofolate cyclohydrolase
MVKILDGTAIAAEIKQELMDEVKGLKEKYGVTPGMALVLVGEDPASKLYVGKKAKTCEGFGIRPFTKFLPEKTTEEELLSLIKELNADPSVHGIVVQLPLPKHIREERITSAISPEKDVDGLNPLNVGKLLMGRECLASPAARGILTILDRSGISVSGKNVVLVGMSDLLGKPLFSFLLQRGAVITACGPKVENLSAYTKRADVLVVDIGRAKAITEDMVKDGAVVIDCGNNFVEGRVVGDVDFDRVKKVVSAITPVPGGVGPMLVVMLMSNLVNAVKRYHLKINPALPTI